MENKSLGDKMSKDMLTGTPLKSILKFALPIYIGNLFQQLYSMVDTIIVGNTLSQEALAGVGATSSLAFLIIGFAQGLCAGLTVITSQRFGASDEEGIKKSFAVSSIISAVFTVVLTLTAVFSAMPLLKLMNTPSDIFDYSYDYIVTIFYGIIATMLYNLTACLLRSLGDSKTPLIFLIVASVLNVGFDLLFIIVAKMGVAGAGWATVLSQGISGILCLIVMLKKFPVLRIKKADFSAKMYDYLHHLKLSIPMAFQFSIIAVGIMVQQTALNSFGSTYIAAYTVAYRIDMVATQLLVSVGMALAVYTGQNYGAGRIDRIKAGVNKSAVFSFIASIVLGVAVVLLAKPLTPLFIKNASAEILDASQEFLFWQAVFFILLASIFIFRNALQGMGYSGLTFTACIVELGMRIFASLVFAKIWGYTGVCVSNPTAWIGAVVLLVPAYYFIVYKKNAGIKINKANDKFLSSADESETAKEITVD